MADSVLHSPWQQDGLAARGPFAHIERMEQDQSPAGWQAIEAQRLAREGTPKVPEQLKPKPRGLHPLFVALIGFLFAVASGAITFLLSVDPLKSWDAEYRQHYGYSGFTEFSVTNFLFEFFVVPGFFIVIYSVLVPILYALKRNRENDQLNVWLIPGAALLVEALLFWASIANPRYLLILGGQALGVTAVSCVALCVWLNRILKRDDAQRAPEKA